MKPDNTVDIRWLHDPRSLDEHLDCDGRVPACLHRSPNDEHRIFRSTEAEPRALFEHHASFCSLLCGMDAKGNAVLLHEPLLAEFLDRELRAFRKVIKETLASPAAIVQAGAEGRIMGAHTPDMPLYEAIRAHLEKLLPVLSYPSTKDLDRRRTVTAEGMLYVPPPFTKKRRAALFLLPADRAMFDRHDIIMDRCKEARLAS